MNGKDAENGIREAINNIKMDLQDLFARIHGIEIGGCPKGNSMQQQVDEMKTEIRSIQNEIRGINKTVYWTSGALAILIIVLQVIAKIIQMRS